MFLSVFINYIAGKLSENTLFDTDKIEWKEDFIRINPDFLE